MFRRTWRRKLGSIRNKWHWRKDCYKWPTDDYETTNKKPSPLCSRCLDLSK